MTDPGKTSNTKPKEKKLTRADQRLEAEAQAQAERAARQAQQAKVSRFTWDMVGLSLLVLGMLLLLGVLGITHGRLIDNATGLMKRLFGYGSFVVAAAVFAAGWLLLLWRKNQAEEVRIGKVVLVELAFFLGLGGFSAFFGDSVEAIKSGTSAGGIAGFGIANPLVSVIGRVPTWILLISAAFVFLLLGFSLVGRVERWARAKMGEDVSEPYRQEATLEVEPEPIEVQVEPPTHKTTRLTQPQKKENAQPALPLEYTKNFKQPVKQTAKSSVQLKRDENLPPLTLLQPEKVVVENAATINMNAGLLEKTLAEFGVPARVIGYRVGPTVTQFAVEPGYIEKSHSDEKQKVRIAQISGLSRDLALALKAERLRIEAPVPGESYVGVEVPNAEHAVVRLRPMLESEEFKRVKSPLAVALGRDVSGQPLVADLASMPHLLIAGTTNSGKSICIAGLTTCLVMNNKPEDLRMVMIDPKMVELRRFNGLPHLLGQVETNVERILSVLRWATTEMDARYQQLERVHSRNLDTYNEKMTKAGKPKLPRIVIMIDELADLMMSAPEQTEGAIVRLAQKARAVGIHLVVATQRPSTDVVTGVIKANFPTRIAFTVASQVDSRVILDTNGAETLLGKGDMLYMHPESSAPRRAQGALVTDGEIERVIRWWNEQSASEGQPLPPPVAHEAEKLEDSPNGEEEAPWEGTVLVAQEEAAAESDPDEALITMAIGLVRKDKRASASYLQRQLRLGYPRAAWLIDKLEERGVIGPAQSGGKERDILGEENGENA